MISFKRNQIKGDPFLMIGTNLPSSYAGLGKELWTRSQKF